MDKARTRGQAKGASSEVNTGHIKLDASLYNSFLILEFALVLIEFINISGLWYNIEGCYIKETAPELGSHEQDSMPFAPV